MRKWVIRFCPLIMLFVLISYGFGYFTLATKVEVPQSLRVHTPTAVLFPKNKPLPKTVMTITTPFLGSSFTGFKEALAFKESQGNYFVTNTLGYLGKYQFGLGTLQLMGVYNTTRFLNNPKLQEKAFFANVSRNKWILRKDIKRFNGERIRGTQITESGILAAAHLAGAGNVKRYLRSYGKWDVKDAYGSNISYYIKKFSGYDLSNIAPKRNAKV